MADQVPLTITPRSITAPDARALKRDDLLGSEMRNMTICTVTDLYAGVRERTRQWITLWLSAELVLRSLKPEVNHGVK